LHLQDIWTDRHYRQGDSYVPKKTHKLCRSIKNRKNDAVHVYNDTCAIYSLL